MSVPRMQGFFGKIQPERSEAWRFLRKPEGRPDLAGGKEHSLSLPKIQSRLKGLWDFEDFGDG